MVDGLLKRCFKCLEEKPRADFYSHPNMADGLSGKCKSCVKARMKYLRRTNPEVQERDRERAKKPHRRQKSTIGVKTWRAKNPERYKATTATGNAIRDGKLKRGPCDQCGADKNVFGIHTDPKKPLDVIWRCAKCHHRSRFEAAE